MTYKSIDNHTPTMGALCVVICRPLPLAFSAYYGGREKTTRQTLWFDSLSFQRRNFPVTHFYEMPEFKVAA